MRIIFICHAVHFNINCFFSWLNYEQHVKGRSSRQIEFDTKWNTMEMDLHFFFKRFSSSFLITFNRMAYIILYSQLLINKSKGLTVPASLSNGMRWTPDPKTEIGYYCWLISMVRGEMANWSLVFWQKSSLRILFIFCSLFLVSLSISFLTTHAVWSGLSFVQMTKWFCKEIIIVCIICFVLEISSFFFPPLSRFIVHQYRNSVEILIFERSYK